MKRFNTLPGLVLGKGSNEHMIMQNALLKSRKKVMNELIPPGTNPTVKTIVSSAMTAIVEHRNFVRPSTDDDSGHEMTGMDKEQASKFIRTIRMQLNDMLDIIEFDGEHDKELQ